MRLIDADKLFPNKLSKDGTLAISQSQIANAPTIIGTCKDCSHNEKCKIQEMADGINSETFYCGYWKRRE